MCSTCSGGIMLWGRERGGKLVEFTLYYRGPLRPNGKPKHKHQVRQILHKQIKELWNQPPLDTHHGLFDPKEALPGIKGNTIVIVEREEVSVVRPVGAYRFAAIVSSELDLVADLTITFLRPGPPGAIVTQGGDIDNRIKTLLDALKIPDGSDALPKGTFPQEDENPFFCLLDDDSLITSLNIKTDRLLDPDVSSSAEVVLLIHVRTRPTVGTFINLGLG
jgi:hypothetical protein